MKKLIVLNLLHLFMGINLYAQKESRYLRDLVNYPTGLTEIQAKYLMDHPGITHTLEDIWSTPKMYTKKYCLTPFDSSVCTVSYLKNVSYNNGWKVSKFTRINANEKPGTALLFRIGFIISLIIIVGPKLFYLVGFLCNVFKKGYINSDYEKYLRLGGTKGDETIKDCYMYILVIGNGFLLFGSHIEAPKTKEGVISIFIWIFLPILTGIILSKLLKLACITKDKVEQLHWHKKSKKVLISK